MLVDYGSHDSNGNSANVNHTFAFIQPFWKWTAQSSVWFLTKNHWVDIKWPSRRSIAIRDHPPRVKIENYSFWLSVRLGETSLSWGQSTDKWCLILLKTLKQSAEWLDSALGKPSAKAWLLATLTRIINGAKDAGMGFNFLRKVKVGGEVGRATWLMSYLHRVTSLANSTFKHSVREFNRSETTNLATLYN